MTRDQLPSGEVLAGGVLGEDALDGVREPAGDHDGDGDQDGRSHDDGDDQGERACPPAPRRSRPARVVLPVVQLVVYREVPMSAQFKAVRLPAGRARPAAP